MGGQIWSASAPNGPRTRPAPSAGPGVGHRASSRSFAATGSGLVGAASTAPARPAASSPTSCGGGRQGRGGEEKGCPAAALLAGRAGFRWPALAAARQGGEGEGACGGGWLGRPPESPDAGARRTCIPRRSGLYNGIRFFRGVLFSRGTTEFDLGRLSRHASEGFLRFIFFKVT